MSNSNGKITIPVSISDVKYVLGEYSNDLGTLCESDNINKWSKHKPICASTINPVYNSESFWRNSNNKTLYGLEIVELEGAMKDAWDMYDTDEENNLNWRYDKPTYTGTYVDSNGIVHGSPYRLGDFSGYYHKAQPICTSLFKKNQLDEVYVSEETSETDYIRFFVDGTMNLDSIKFTDLEVLDPNAKLVLCANVFNTYTDLIGEYINDNIKLYSYTTTSTLKSTSSIDNYEYDEPSGRWKFIDVKFDKPTYFSSGTFNTYWILLTLDFVKYNSTSHQWISTRKFVIPYTDDNYYSKRIKFTKVNRVIEPQMIQVGVSANYTLIWQSIWSPVASGDWIRSPRIKFSVSRTTQPITFARLGERGYYLRAKYIKNNSVVRSVVGSLYPSTSKTITAGTGTDEIIVDFGGLFDENEYITGQTFEADLYLVDNTNGGITESNMDSYSTKLNNQKIILRKG